MSDTSDSSGAQVASSRREVILTSKQAAEAQKRYEAFVAEFEANRTTPPDPHDYWTYKGLWARAYGADQIRVVD
jgi:hypothetical protein